MTLEDVEGVDAARRRFAFYMGRAAGTASRVGLERLSHVLALMGRTPTEFYDVPPAEAAYMREALELLAARWLPLEASRCGLSEAEESELRGALALAIEEARTIERVGDPPGTIPLRKRESAP